MHELGHAIFGFYHDPETGYTNYPSGLMDYRGAVKPGANYSPAEQLEIKNSKW